MQRVNISAPAFTYDDEDPAGSRAGLFRFGPQLGAQQTGTSVYELPPGQALCPYHYEYGEEEWLLVLQGHPSVRDPDGTHTLEPDDGNREDDLIVPRSSQVDYWHDEPG